METPASQVIIFIMDCYIHEIIILLKLKRRILVGSCSVVCIFSLAKFGW